MSEYRKNVAVISHLNIRASLSSKNNDQKKGIVLRIVKIPVFLRKLLHSWPFH
jgi:hypothetical protein